MKINVIENEKNKLKLEFCGESTMLTNLIAKKAWEKGGEAAAVREHPFLVEPKLLVNGSDPKKILEKSLESLEEECDEFKAELQKELKK